MELEDGLEGRSRPLWVRNRARELEGKCGIWELSFMRVGGLRESGKKSHKQATAERALSPQEGKAQRCHLGCFREVKF